MVDLFNYFNYVILLKLNMEHLEIIHYYISIVNYKDHKNDCLALKLADLV